MTNKQIAMVFIILEGVCCAHSNRMSLLLANSVQSYLVFLVCETFLSLNNYLSLLFLLAFSAFARHDLCEFVSDWPR